MKRIMISSRISWGSQSTKHITQRGASGVGGHNGVKHARREANATARQAKPGEAGAEAAAPTEVAAAAAPATPAAAATRAAPAALDHHWTHLRLACSRCAAAGSTVGTYYNVYRTVRGQYAFAVSDRERHVDKPGSGGQKQKSLDDLKFWEPGLTKKAALETPGLGGKLGVDELGYSRWGAAADFEPLIDPWLSNRTQAGLGSATAYCAAWITSAVGANKSD